MNRRSFFKLTAGGVALAAATAREWPFRVFSFPEKIEIAKTADVERAAQQVLDPIVAMALNGSNAYFRSGKFRRPTQEEFDDYMGMRSNFPDRRIWIPGASGDNPHAMPLVLIPDEEIEASLPPNEVFV